VLLAQAVLLQTIAETGGVESTWISWLLVASAFPAVSQALYFTVVVVETPNGTV
jgi:hypothetical protein